MCIRDSEIPVEIEQLAKKREEARNNKDFDEADRLRDVIAEKGFTLEDVPEGYKISKQG